MVRPKASAQMLAFAANFADAVTTKSHRPFDCVARTGKYSIFMLLASLAPKARSSHTDFSKDYTFRLYPIFQTIRSEGRPRPNRCWINYVSIQIHYFVIEAMSAEMELPKRN